MNPFIAALVGGFIQAAGTMVGRVMIALGFTYITYSGLDSSFGWIKNQIAAEFGGLPAQALAVLSAARVGSAVAVVMSAIAARMVLNGLVDGARKLVVK